jgi:hypothetical protein
MKLLNLVKYLGFNSILINNIEKPIRFLSIKNIKQYYLDEEIYYDLYNDFCTTNMICEDEYECYLTDACLDKYDKYNSLTAEHIWPQSFMKEYTNANIDMHNIYMTESKLNSQRSNYKYIDELTFTENYNNSKLIKINQYNFKNNENKVFIPNVNTRGAIARSIAYMKYTYPELKLEKVIDIDLVMSWCLLYPPTKLEIKRNEIIKAIQGNDNIFISEYNKFTLLFYYSFYLKYI